MGNSILKNTPDSTPLSKRANSECQRNAKRANAQKSTGPPKAIAAAASNCLKHGLTAQAVGLPDEPEEEYEVRRAEYFEDVRPATLLNPFREENRLVSRRAGALLLLAVLLLPDS